MKIALLIILIVLAGIAAFPVVIGGCDAQPINRPAIVILPDGEQIAVDVGAILPPETTYTGEGVIYRRKVDAVRIVSPFGVSPGETISKQQPAQIQTGAPPAITIGPGGLGVSKGEDTQFVGGGGKWTWWDSIKTGMGDLLWGVGLLAVGLLILSLFVPSLLPTLIGWAKKFLAWLFPAIGRAFAALKQTVEGLDAAKAELRSNGLAEAWAVVSKHLAAAQDEASKAQVEKYGNASGAVPAPEPTAPHNGKNLLDD